MKRKKILAVLLAALLACGVFPAGAFAEGQDLYLYSVKYDGTAEITGIRDEDIEIMEIPAELGGYKVTSIGDFAFVHCSNVVSVTIPEGVTTIAPMAFGNCFRLESVSLPDSLAEIGWSAFRSERLTEIKISPDHPVFAVENEALIDKTTMTLVRFLAPEITGTYEIAQGIRAIGPFAFELDRQLSSVVIPDSVTEIGAEAFAYCNSLKEIVIPDSVVSIGSGVFSFCWSLESVKIPDSVTEIGTDIFSYCSALKSIGISPDHPVYEVTDLLLVKKADKEIIAASGAIRGKYAVPEGIRGIGGWAFQGCRDLEELFIPDTVTTIGEYPFDSNTVIRACAGSAAYRYCAENSEVRFTEITPEAYAEEVRKLEQAKADGEPAEPGYLPWEEYRDIQVSGMYQYQVLQDGTAQITKADAFLTDGNIPAELDGYPVTSIGVDAFMDCDSLRSVVIPEGVVSLECYAFSFCDGLESVSIPDSLIIMDRNPFDYCRKLKTVEVSPYHSVYAAARGALYDRLSLTLITVLDHEDTGTFTVAQGTRRIEEGAFEGSRFSSVILPDSVREIGSQAFSGCKNLTEIILPEGVTTIDSQAFYGSENLQSVTLPDSLTRISAGIFGYNKALTEVRISPDHPAYEMNGHLLADKRTQEIVMALNSTPSVFEIPEGIRAIGNMAFQGSEGLKELIVPEGVEKIGRSAFSGCADLHVITLPASLKEIEEFAFQYSRGLLIKAPAGSWAEKYARENGYRFEVLSADTALFEYKVKADGTAEITKADQTLTNGNIPAELDGHPVTSIGDDAFTDCESLQSVMIPEGVVSVGGDAFWNCSALESISIPDSLVSLEPGAFAFCRKLNTVEVSPDHPVLAVENKALVNRQDQMLLCVLDHEDTGTYEVAQGIRQIAVFAFDGASFSSILLPGSLTSVRSLAFNDCGNLTEIILPEGVTELGHQAFYGSKKLESVTIPDSLTQIGMATFGHNPAMKFVRISPDHPAYEMNGPLLVDKRNQKIIATLNSMPEFYKIPEGIRSIGEMAFQGCYGVTELTVPEGVEEIGYSAFCGCVNLKVITLPGSLDEIGNGIFEYGPEGLLIKAPAGSRAEQYALDNGYGFEALPAGTDGAD